MDQPTQPDEGAYEYAAVAPNAEEMARQWERFRLTGAPPELDFATEVALLVGFGESGSCPMDPGGLEIHPSRRRVIVVDATDYPRTCTDDYNSRTWGFRIERRLLPEGVFLVEPPNGALVSVAANPVAEAPQEDPVVLSGPSTSRIRVVLAPEPVLTDGRIAVSVDNRSRERVVGNRIVYLDRWTGLGFEPANTLQVEGGRHVMSARPGTEKDFMVMDVAAAGLEPGWYRITVDLDPTTSPFGRVIVRGTVKVIEAVD